MRPVVAVMMLWWDEESTHTSLADVLAWLDKNDPLWIATNSLSGAIYASATGGVRVIVSDATAAKLLLMQPKSEIIRTCERATPQERYVGWQMAESNLPVDKFPFETLDAATQSMIRRKIRERR